MDDLYAFVMRGDLTAEAISSTGLSKRHHTEESLEEFASALSLDLMDSSDIEVAQKMAIVYTAITAFERGARQFVRRVLIDEFGDQWWEDGVTEKIRKFAESRRQDELKTKWHGDRGEDLLDYTEMGHLPKIIDNNWTLFEPHVARLEWARALFSAVERSRNIIMHGGLLDIKDAERVGMNIRDWSRQVGS